ncbi:MAG: polymerase subunit gamma/tau [Candidatus Saccharibacteria bacterium]|nr:polymerase subunit gamma/tau [Candidatus Saccharibacteria bacterium]
MGQALYRKYRSKSFDEVVGQDHITKTLESAIKSGRISHAYLFTGPRGVGKTSVARILAHAVNGLTYDSEAAHLDIIEIDAASNRRIDEIRDLREKVHISPTSSKYKVYIIDEVHMLTREAFNALLKTLEEPPAHVIFILATTEAHKLPETIISRTQRYNFKAVGRETAYTHLKGIAKSEKVDIDDGALKLLAEFGDGSFRDSISLLDQLGSSGVAITEEVAREHLGLPKDAVVAQLLQACENGDLSGILELINQLRDQAIDAANVAKLMADLLRDRIVNGGNVQWHASLLKQLISVSAAAKPFDVLEIALLEAATENSAPAPTSPTADKKTAPASVQARVEKIVEKVEEMIEQEPEAAPASLDNQITTTSQNGFDLAMWEEVISLIKKEAPALYTALRLAVPKLEGQKLILAFEFPLHQKKVNQAHCKDIVATTIEKLSGSKLAVSCIIDKPLVISARSQPEPGHHVQEEPAPEPVSSLQTISNIFGSAEMLES